MNRCYRLHSDCTLNVLFIAQHETFLEMLNWKMRFDESDSLAVRMVRGFTDKVASLIGELLLVSVMS